MVQLLIALQTFFIKQLLFTSLPISSLSSYLSHYCFPTVLTPLQLSTKIGPGCPVGLSYPRIFSVTVLSILASLPLYSLSPFSSLFFFLPSIALQEGNFMKQACDLKVIHISLHLHPLFKSVQCPCSRLASRYATVSHGYVSFCELLHFG